jgi:hypothetical protein
MFYDITDTLSFSSFLSFPELHRVVPLLQTCSTYEFVHDHACFCVYVYLLDLSPMYERKHVTFVFLSLACFTLKVVHTCNPSNQEAEAGSLRSALATLRDPVSSKTKQNKNSLLLPLNLHILQAALWQRQSPALGLQRRSSPE